MSRKAHSPTNSPGAPPADAPAPPAPAAPASGFPLGQLVDVPLALIDPDPDNERGAVTAGLEDLQTSLREHGQIEPIRLYALPDGRFMNQTGHRRCAALRALGRPTVRALIAPLPADQVQRALDRVVANLHQQPPDPIKLATTLGRLLDLEGVSQATLAPRFGHSQEWISNLLRLLKLPPPVQKLISSSKLTPGHGVALLRIKEPELAWSGQPTGKTAADIQTGLAQTVADEGSSVRDLGWRIDQYFRQQQMAQHERARQADLARQTQEAAARAMQVREQARAAGQDTTAAVQADPLARAGAEVLKQQAATTREKARLEERARRATAVIDRVIGYNPAEVPSLDLLRLAAVVAYEGSGGTYRERDAWHQRIDAAADLPALLKLLAELGRRALPLDPERRAVGGNWDIRGWADPHWGINRAIADDLLAARLINARSHAMLIEAAAKPRQPVVEEGITSEEVGQASLMDQGGVPGAPAGDDADALPAAPLTDAALAQRISAAGAPEHMEPAAA